jgi:hypothetical protein
LRDVDVDFALQECANGGFVALHRRIGHFWRGGMQGGGKTKNERGGSNSMSHLS